MIPAKGRYRFTGQNGSMGLRTGQVYMLDFRVYTSPFGEIFRNQPFYAAPAGHLPIPYSSPQAFWRNWKGSR